MFKIPEGLEIQDRPERISKLALYLIDKEPLIYLFIINSDFIPDPDGKAIGSYVAGVYFSNNRVQFFYKPKEFEETSREELLFILVHEAFHIFKKHIERHQGLKDSKVRNIAEDAVINHEILNLGDNFEGLIKPKMYNNDCIVVPLNFLRENSQLGNDAIETHRLYHWLKKRQEEQFKKNFRVGHLVKIKNEKDENQQYGKIVEKGSGKSWKVERMSRKELLDNSMGKGSTTEEKSSNLIPVVTGNLIKNDKIPGKDFENIAAFDYHIHNGEDIKEEEEALVEKNFFADKIIAQAEKMEDQLNIERPAGTGRGGIISRLKQMNKPQINWKKELGRKMNVFMSKNSFLYRPVPSFINYPWNPRSRYGILGKHPVLQRQNLQTYIIFAIDTSGSVFSSREELERFFTEVDAASKQLEFTRKGHVLTLQWDWEIQEGLRIYKAGDWKNFQVQGGGGTGPQSVFKYLNETFQDRGNRYLVDTNGIQFLTENKKKLPYLIILTDGYFYGGRINDKTLGVYANNKDNILYFTKSIDSIYPRENYIKYS